MSFISILKSPLKNKYKIDAGSITSSTYSALNTRRLVIYPIDTEDDANYTLIVNNDDAGDLLMTKVCDNYGLIAYKEYFGLKYTVTDEKDNHEILWIDLLKPVGKQLKYSNNMLTLRIKHFPANPHQIECEHVRYLIYLQLKNYLQKGELQLSLADECILAAYVVQATLEDYDPAVHIGNYIENEKLISKKTNKSDEIIIEEHKKLRGLKRVEAECLFLEKVSRFNTYGAEIVVLNNKQDVLVNFAVSHNGILTYLHGQQANVARIDLYLWSQIGKVCYENRKLYIHAHTPNQNNPEIIKKHQMVFKCYSERMCKQLWKFILDQKAFFQFKHSSDVPKMKSSSGLFKRTSKFRYSGRCEHEILLAQNDSQNNSLNLTSPSTFRRKFNYKPNQTVPALATEQSKSSLVQQPIYENPEKSFTDSGVSDNLSEITTGQQKQSDDALKNDEIKPKIDESSLSRQEDRETPAATSTPQQAQKQKQIDRNKAVQLDTSMNETDTSYRTSDHIQDSIEKQFDDELLREEQLKTNNNNNNNRTQWISYNFKFFLISILLLIIIFLLILNYQKKAALSPYYSLLRNSVLSYDPIFAYFFKDF